jgi:hypothetical protein
MVSSGYITTLKIIYINFLCYNASIVDTEIIFLYVINTFKVYYFFNAYFKKQKGLDMKYSFMHVLNKKYSLHMKK